MSRLFVLLGLSWGILVFSSDNKSLEDLQAMEGFKTLLQRGEIPAIRKPHFVKADEAKDLADNAWVIGVSYQGQAKAYSINLLNQHEIVNDKIGDKPIATTW